MMVCCGMAVKRMVMLRVRVRKMMALTVKMETVTLIGIGRQNLTCLCIKCMQLIVIFFFCRHIISGGVALDLDKNIFPWQMCLIWGFVFESSHLAFG
jgi:hypothetical protein